MKRGGLRQLVEEICIFFDKYRESEEEEVETWRKGGHSREEIFK